MVPSDIGSDRAYIDRMSVVVRFLRLGLMLAFPVGIAAQTWPAAADTSRMAALHAEAMHATDHDMGAMAEPSGDADDMAYPGVLTLCQQHCTATSVVLPAPPTPPAASARLALIAWPSPVDFASIEPVPAGPPPKVRSV